MWKGVVVSGASLPGLDPVYSVMNLVWGRALKVLNFVFLQGVILIGP